MNTITVYGIPNCDTIKKTLNWITKKNIAFVFHDYKRSGISKEKLAAWCRQVGWEVLLNKKSTTWRDLSPAVQQKVFNQTTAIKLMMDNNSIIKRPVIETGKILLVGFKETELTRAFT
jgi:Spx/MgsR family transcriptional regulator